MEYVINNNTSYDLTQLEELARQFLPFAQKRMGFNKPPIINFASDEENCANPLGKTASYSPSDMQITILVDKRHIKDILRSLSHELVHHNQNCRGDFNREFSTAPGYAQDDEFLRNMEDEAYREGNFCLRDWEDGIKTSKIKNIQLNETIYKRTVSAGDNNMSTKDWKDKELNSLLMEKWGYTLKEELTSYMDEKDYSTAQMGSLEDGEAELRKEEDDDEREVELESQLPEEHPHSPDQREVKKKINNESVSYSKKILQEKLDRKDVSALYEKWLTEGAAAGEPEEDKAVKEPKSSEEEESSSTVESALSAAKQSLSKIGDEGDQGLKDTSPERKLDILNQMCAGRGPIMDMFEKDIEAMVKQGYLDQKEDINLKQVTFLTKDGLKTVQATACKAKKALVAVGKKNRENKKRLEESLARGSQLESDILLYEFRQQQHYRKSVHYVDHALGLLAEGKSENLFPAIVLLNEFWQKGGQLAISGLTKAAGTRLGGNIMKKMMKRGGFGSKTAWKALKGTAAQQAPKGGWKAASKAQLKQALKDRGVKLTGKETKSQLVKKMKAWRPGRQLSQNKAARLAAKAQKKAAKKAAKQKAKQQAAKEAGKKAGKEGAEEVVEGFWKNIAKGRIGRALLQFCKKNKWTCRALGVYGAISVIGNVIGPDDLSSSSEVDAEQQRLLDAMSDKQLKDLCAKGNQVACIELKVRESDREAGRLPRTPDSGIGGQGAAGAGGADPFAGSHNKKGSRVLGMSVKWIEKRGWKYMPANDDFAKPGRPDYWLKRDHCKGTKYCSNRGKGRKKVKVTKSEPIMSKDVAVTGVGGAEFGPGTSGMSPITLTNPNTGEVEGLTRAGQKAMEAPLPPDVLKAREEYERSLKENK